MLTLHPILISNHSSHCLSVLVKDDSSFNYPHKPGHGRPNVMPSGPKEQSQVLFKVILVHMFCVFLSLIFTEKKMQWSLFSFDASLLLLLMLSWFKLNLRQTTFDLKINKKSIKISFPTRNVMNVLNCTSTAHFLSAWVEASAYKL